MERAIEVISKEVTLEEVVRKEFGYDLHAIREEDNLGGAAEWIRKRQDEEGGVKGFVDSLSPSASLGRKFEASEYRFVLDYCYLGHLNVEKLAGNLKKPDLALDVRQMFEQRYSALCEEMEQSICRKLVDMAEQVQANEQKKLATTCRQFLQTAEMLKNFSPKDFERHVWHERLQSVLGEFTSRSPSDVNDPDDGLQHLDCGLDSVSKIQEIPLWVDQVSKVLADHCEEQRSKTCQAFLARLQVIGKPDWDNLLAAAQRVFAGDGAVQWDSLELVSHIGAELSKVDSGVRAAQLLKFLEEHAMGLKADQHVHACVALLRMADKVKADEIMVGIQEQLAGSATRRASAAQHKERLLELLCLGPGSTKHDQSTWGRLVSLMRLYLDRLELLIKQNLGDVWDVEPEKFMQRVVSEVEERTKLRGTADEDGLDPEHVFIQKRLADHVNSQAFKAFKDFKATNTLPNAFTQFTQLLQWSDGFAPMDSSFKVAACKSVPVEDWFDARGRILKEVSKEDLCTQVVSASYTGTPWEYYQLTADYQNLKKHPEKLESDLAKYKDGLERLHRKQRLWQFQSDLATFDAEPCLQSLHKVVVGLTFFLVSEGQVVKQRNNLQCFKEFLELFSRVMEPLLLVEQEHQRSANELKLAIDIFSESMDSLETQGGAEELVCQMDKQLSSLRSLLNFKAYWDSGVSCVEQERAAFQALPREDLASQRCAEIQACLSEVMWLRRTMSQLPAFSECAKLFEECSHKMEPAARSAEENSRQWLDDLFRTLQQAKQSLLTFGMPVPSVEMLAEQTQSGVLTWEEVLKAKSISPDDRVWQLQIILFSCQSNFKAESLRRLILALVSWDETSEVGQALAKRLLVMYLKAEMSEQSIKESVAQIWQSLLPGLRGFTLCETGANWALWQDLLDHVKALCCGHLRHQVQFILRLISSETEKKEQENEETEEVNEVQAFTVPRLQKWLAAARFSVQLRVLKLLLLLPDAEFSDEALFGVFREALNLEEQLRQGRPAEEKDLEELRALHREHLGRFLKLRMLRLFEAQVAADAVDALQRLFHRLAPADFLELGWWLMENLELLKDSENPVISGCRNFWKEEDEVFLKFASESEKVHLQQLLWGKAKVGPHDGPDPLCEAFCSSQRADIREVFRNPVASWHAELVELRLRKVCQEIVQRRRSEEYENGRLKDLVDALCSLCEQRDRLGEALEVMELLKENLESFKSAEEVKAVLRVLLQQDDFADSVRALRTDSGQQLVVNLLLSGVKFQDKFVQTKLDNLKFLLEGQPFKDLQTFAKVFSAAVLGQKDAFFVGMDVILDLVIESQAFRKPRFLLSLSEVPLIAWPRQLHRELIRARVDEMGYGSAREKHKQKLVEMLSHLRAEKGERMFEAFLDFLSDLNGKRIKDINRLLSKLLSKGALLSNLLKLKGLGDQIDQWERTLFFSEGREDRDLHVSELIEMMQADNKTAGAGVNATIANLIEGSGVCDLLATVGYRQCAKGYEVDFKRKLLKSLAVSETESWACKDIGDWSKEDVSGWAKAFRSQHIDVKKLSLEGGEKALLADVLSVLARAVQLFQDFAPRVTQMMAIMFLLSGQHRGMLANVSTGEGKTLITAMLATILGLCGKSVDVLTSSKVLAVRDSKRRDPETREGYADFFALFNLTCSNNCDDQCERSEEERKKRYEDACIMYGEAGFFQRDILLTKFFGKGIRPGSGIADALILDEVDNMMLDNATRTLYISHHITDMRHLRDLFIRLWAAVNGKESAYTEDNVRKIKKYVKKITSSCQEVQISHKQLAKKLKRVAQPVELTAQAWKEIGRFCQGQRSVQVSESFLVELQDSQAGSTVGGQVGTVDWRQRDATGTCACLSYMFSEICSLKCRQAKWLKNVTRHILGTTCWTPSSAF